MASEAVKPKIDNSRMVLDNSHTAIANSRTALDNSRTSVAEASVNLKVAVKAVDDLRITFDLS